MKNFFLFSFSFLSFYLHAQNLVPNPSFEDTVHCPTNVGSGIDSNVVAWHSCRQSPDYINACADSATLVSVPYNIWGYQYPHTGNAYMAMQCFFTSQYREYFGCQLLSPLVIGQHYYVSFYVNCAFGGLAYAHGGSNKTGVLFSTVPWSYSSPAPIGNFAHIYTDSIITDTVNWIQIKGSFIADSSYNYLTIGNFFNDANTDTVQYMGGVRAVYLIDDVCVSTDSLTCSGEILENIPVNRKEIACNIFPNPVTNKLRIENAEGIKEVEIYNTIGEKLYSQQHVTNDKQQTVDVRQLLTGIYFVAVMDYKGNKITRRFVKM